MIFGTTEKATASKIENGDLFRWRQNRDSFFGVSAYSIAHSKTFVKW